MDYTRITFLKHQSIGGMNFQWRDRNLTGFIKNKDLIRALENNNILDLEQY